MIACSDSTENQSPGQDAGTQEDTGAQEDTDNVPDTGEELPFEVRLERVGGSAQSAFELQITGSSEGEPTVTAARGEVGELTQTDTGYVVTVTPSGSGEHEVTVEWDGATLTRTAVVFPTVAEGWGQPQAVEGYVNTPGYEDGVTISPNGEYLFVQYGPVYFSGIILFGVPREQGGCGGHRLEPDRCTHPWIDNVVGPIGPPERPGFFQGRVTEDGQHWRHNAASWGVDDEVAPVLAVSTMFYGFKRQPDGSFKEPFYVAFDDQQDGIVGPFGLSFVERDTGDVTVAFSLNDFEPPILVDFDGDGTDDADPYFDVYTTTMRYGEDTILGTYVPSGQPGTTPVRGTPFPSEPVAFSPTGIDGIAGTQGNCHLHAPQGQINSIWTDDEHDEGGDHGELSVYVRQSGVYPGGEWQKVVLPEAINNPSPSEEIQPFFTGSELFYTRLGENIPGSVRVAAYTGQETTEGFADNGNWGAHTDVLVAGDYTDGGVVAVGEPTVAFQDGKEVLYFVYGVIRGFDESGLPDINMQAGFVERLP